MTWTPEVMKEAIANNTDLSYESVDQMYKETREEIRNVTNADKIASLESEEDIDDLTCHAIKYLIEVCICDEEFERKWQEFIDDISPFFVGYIYYTEFPDRAREGQHTQSETFKEKYGVGDDRYEVD